MASHVSPQQRIFTAIIAFVFLATAIASTGLIVWQIQQDNKNAKLQQEATDAINKQNGTTPTPQEGKLEGTKLADFTPNDARVTELQVIDLKEGTGDPVKAGGTVTAHYTGALVKTGVIFQSSKDTGQPFTAPLSNLIKGWQEGIPNMKPGGIRRLVIPAAQAYGSNAQGGIPADSDLVFDIELVSAQ